MKPNNPYKKGTTIWSVMEGDWEDLTSNQIAEVLGVGPMTVRSCIQRIKKETGYDVQYVKGSRNYKIYESLKNDDWSDMTVREISDLLDVTPQVIYKYIDLIKKETGIEVKYKRSRR